MEVTDIVEEATMDGASWQMRILVASLFLLPKCFEENHYFCYIDIDCMIGKLPVQAWSSIKKPV